jgi:hypothetical protein
MRIFTHKSVRLSVGLPAAIAVSAGMGLSVTAVDLATSPRAAVASPRVAVGSPQAAVASPRVSVASAQAAVASAVSIVAPSHPGRHGRISKRLKAAILTAADLPAGYTVIMEPTETDSSTTVDACGKPVPPANPGKPPDNATVMFLKEKTLDIVSEGLTAVGDKAARDVVADYADAPRRCPTVTMQSGDDEITWTQSPLRVPRLGDASTGLRLVLKMVDPTPDMYGKVVVIAWHDVSIALVVVGVTEPDQHKVEKLAAKALRKLKRQG